MNKIKAEHFSPPAIDEKFHDSIIEEFIEILDPAGLYFLESDVKEISAFPLHLNDPTKSNSCEFIDKAAQVYQKRLTEAVRIVSLKTAKSFDYSKNDSLYFSVNQTTGYEKTISELERHWEIWLKASTLSRMAQTAKAMTVKDWMAVEKVSREKVRDKTLAKLNRLLRGSVSPKEFVGNALLKSIALSFDPHTNYFTQSEIKDFESSLSSSAYSFGFDLDENALGETVVDRLAPGGPAWNSHLINKGDAIISVSWPNREVSNPLDFDDNEFEGKINSADRLSGTFTFKKADGSSVEVLLHKEKRESIESNVQSLLLKGEKSVGYISLPGFYSDWGGEGQSCASDVAKEIIKLKKENIQGLILDLRFNGGGSVQEAIELAGIFIDVGPMALSKSKDGQIISLKDIHKGFAYDGPLVILMNGFSASASEITTAALQDYNRALVVGSTSYGKATAQNVFPLIQGKDSLGFVKITLSKAYRITGKSHQRKGVQPDIYLPDFYSILQISERTNRHALPSDSVIKKVYYTPLTKPTVAPLKNRSEERIQNSAWFKQLRDFQNFYQAPQSLEINAYIQHHLASQAHVKQLDETKSASTKPLYRVMQNKFDGALLGLDENRNLASQELLKEIERSAYIEEAFQIILNYLSLTKP
ncbi:MAG: carboxy terminal-processing peptidase [Cyclobacteriaceae bacterium]|nr:carboxy terminal-processing peptidase [Cyclobacteriaceae bacterium]